MVKYLNPSQYILPFLLTFALSCFFTLVVRRLALKKNIVDSPAAAPGRKVHSQPVPLLGGLAIFLAIFLAVLFYTLFTDRVLGGYLLPKHLLGIFLAGILLMIGGYLDDKYNLTALKQIIWPVLACVVVIGAGIGVNYITNPLGGVLSLDTVKIKLFSINNIPYFLTLFADIFAFVWLMGMMYTTKFLDGLDGLVAGITAIGGIILFFLSLNKVVAQPETALLSVILAGACLGFLIFNFHPAKIFLGEGGSLFAGFMLGVLSIISGAKIATALLILGVPILDVAWVIIRRLFFERKSPFATSDRKHLHFRLLDVGLSHRQAVLFLYIISLLFGGVALIAGSRQKLAALLILLVSMVVLGVVLVRLYRHRQARTQAE